ncbi:MAG: MYG1 family protein [Proteobacteria bacterium]|nr:MYG1 family protein [Pseudomonadota bacterium]
MIIVTHNGSFHADDVFSIAALKLLFTNVEVIRTRDPKIIEKADIVVDVGQVYNHDLKRYDHHQKGGAGVHEQTGIKMSSIGLIWKHYGLGIIKNVLEELNIIHPIEILKQIADRINWNLIQLIDAGDTGMAIHEQIYNGVQPYTISQIISNCNPDWNSDEDFTFDEAFEEALILAKPIIVNEIHCSEANISARSHVLEYIQEAQTSKNPRVIIFKQHMPWMGTVIKNTYDELYVVYPGPTGEDWRIQCIPDKVGSFGKRKPLPESWADLEHEKLNKIIGIDDATFAHGARFIAGAKSLESVLKMAEIAINSKE